MEKLQHRHLHGHQTSKDSDFIAAITPTPSSLARYHSAASPEASAALLAVPKTQQMTFPNDDDDDDYIYSFYRTSSHIITT